MRKISLAKTGKKLTKEHRQKLSESKIKFFSSKENRVKQSETLKNLYKRGYIHPMTGKKYTKEQLKKMSETAKKLYASGKYNPRLGIKASPKLRKKLSEVHFKPKLLSKINSDHSVCNMILIDKIGILADIYKYCKLSYVGSGFSDGVHSVIEPGVYGCAVSYGPNIELLDEAKYINNKGIGTMVHDEKELSQFLKLYLDMPTINNLGNKVKDYIISHKNVSKKIIKLIESKI